MVDPKNTPNVHDNIFEERYSVKTHTQGPIGTQWFAGKVSETALLIASETQPKRISPRQFRRSLYHLHTLLSA